MLKEGLLREVLKRSLSGGGDYGDIFVEWRHSAYIKLEDSKIEEVVEGIDSGVGIRVLFNGKTAYAFSNAGDKHSLFELSDTLAKAVESGKVIKALDLRRKKPNINFEIKLLPSMVSMERKIKMVLSGDTTARAKDRRVKQVSIIYKDSTQKVQIATSDGTLTEDERIYTHSVINVVASENSVVQTGYESTGGLIGFELFDETPLSELSLKATSRAIQLLRARMVSGGRMPVVISGKAGGTMIHEAIGHGLEADLAQEGLSAFSRKLNQKVASSLITVIDDATLQNKRGSFRFDDEGTPSQRTVLVKDGVLLGYMHDRLSAFKSESHPTGNGRRQSYAFRPIPRMTNTFIEAGNSSLEDILRQTQNGLFVKKMGGGQVNTVTGDFVFDVLEGYLISGGLIGEPVRGATLTGNGPEVLSSIDMLGDDLGFSIGTCGKDSQLIPVTDGMPTLRVPEMVVGGRV